MIRFRLIRNLYSFFDKWREYSRNVVKLLLLPFGVYLAGVHPRTYICVTARMTQAGVHARTRVSVILSKNNKRRATPAGRSNVSRES